MKRFESKFWKVFLVMSWFESKYSGSFLSHELIWIRFQKSILSHELIWVNSCKSTVSHELSRIKTSWDWVDPNKKESYPCLLTTDSLLVWCIDEVRVCIRSSWPIGLAIVSSGGGALFFVSVLSAQPTASDEPKRSYHQCLMNRLKTPPPIQPPLMSRCKTIVLAPGAQPCAVEV